MKKIGVAIVSIIMILGILVGVLGFVSNGFKNFDMFKKVQPAIEKIKDFDPKDVLDEFGNKINDGFKHAFTNKMSFSQGALTASEGQGVTVTLEANVYPTYADNRLVDWSVAWRNSENSTVVNNYLTVSPEYDGSTIARVTCKKAFVGDIDITVITRERGFSNTCTVSFVGIPSSMIITPLGDISVAYEKGWGVDVVSVNNVGDISFDIAFDNVYHSIDKNFAPNYVVEVVGFGTFNGIYLASNDREEDIIISDISLGQNMMHPFYPESYDPLSFLEIFNFKPFIKQNQLNFNMEECLPGLYTYFSDNSGEATTDNHRWLKFHSYTDINKKPYFQVKVTETITKISQIVNVRADAKVKSVSFAESTLRF